MTQPELQEILKALDAAIAVFAAHKGALTAGEVSVKSMLLVLRGQISTELKRQHAGTGRPEAGGE